MGGVKGWRAGGLLVSAGCNLGGDSLSLSPLGWPELTTRAPAAAGRPKSRTGTSGFWEPTAWLLRVRVVRSDRGGKEGAVGRGRRKKKRNLFVSQSVCRPPCLSLLDSALGGRGGRTRVVVVCVLCACACFVVASKVVVCGVIGRREGEQEGVFLCSARPPSFAPAPQLSEKSVRSSARQSLSLSPRILLSPPSARSPFNPGNDPISGRAPTLDRSGAPRALATPSGARRTAARHRHPGLGRRHPLRPRAALSRFAQHQPRRRRPLERQLHKSRQRASQGQPTARSTTRSDRLGHRHARRPEHARPAAPASAPSAPSAHVDNGRSQHARRAHQNKVLLLA